MPNVRLFRAIALLVVMLPIAGPAAALTGYCGELQNAFGPFDFRTVEPRNRHVVEEYHFTPQVETLRMGQNGTVASDLDYTLRAMPNHPRALMAMMKLTTKVRNEKPDGAKWPAECYIDRAVRFAPSDPMPHLIYAIYLKDRKRMGEVKAQLAEAERLRGDPGSFDFDYNLGLLYFDVGDYDRATVSASRAYALGAPFDALKKKLKGVGRNVAAEPPAAARAADSAKEAAKEATTATTPADAAPKADDAATR